MTVAELLRELSVKGIEFFVAGDRLKRRSPPGAYLPEIRDMVECNRAAILLVLSDVDETVANVSMEPESVRVQWRKDVVASERWIDAHEKTDSNSALDYLAIRRLVPLGACLDCDTSMKSDGRRFCDTCSGTRSSSELRNLPMTG